MKKNIIVLALLISTATFAETTSINVDEPRKSYHPKKTTRSQRSIHQELRRTNNPKRQHVNRTVDKREANVVNYNNEINNQCPKRQALLRSQNTKTKANDRSMNFEKNIK